MSKDSSGNSYQRLHALDLSSGGEEFGGPINIQARYPGTGDNSSGGYVIFDPKQYSGYVIFDPKQYKERPGLLLVNHTIYTFWSSHCDIRPYSGWIISSKVRNQGRRLHSREEGRFRLSGSLRWTYAPTIVAGNRGQLHWRQVQLPARCVNCQNPQYLNQASALHDKRTPD